MDQQDIMKIQMMEQEVNQLNEQLKIVEQNVGEMNSLKDSLSEIEGENNMLANLGKKIYVPVEIKDKKLIVDIGNNVLIKKSIPDTMELVEKQTGGLIEVQGQIMERLKLLEGEMGELIKAIQEEQMKNGVEKSGDK